MTTYFKILIGICFLFIGNKTYSQEEQSIVFIAGFDDGTNTYYNSAKDYFINKNKHIIDSLYSLAEIINWLNKHDENYDEIHIVCHSNAWRGMSMKTIKEGERITAESLAKAKKNGLIPELEICVDEDAKIIFHSCGLGENEELLKQLSTIFQTEVYASSFFNIFGGKYAAHYLAKPFYGFYPTAESPGQYTLAKEFKSNYPDENIDWLNALKTRKEQRPGEIYTYKFNIPVKWEFTFDDKKDIPNLENRDQIMDWIVEDEEIVTALFKLNIPIEKYRWRSQQKGKTLLIKGKTTVLCVLQPIMEKEDNMEYRTANLEDNELYSCL